MKYISTRVVIGAIATIATAFGGLALSAPAHADDLGLSTTVLQADPGEVTPSLRIFPRPAIQARLVVVAPEGLTIDSISDSRSTKYEIINNGTAARSTTGGRTFGYGYGATLVNFRIPADSEPGTVFEGGKVEFRWYSNGALGDSEDFQVKVNDAKLTLTSHSENALATENITFSGLGQPGRPIEIRGTDGATIVSGTIEQDGTWTLTVPSLPEGPGTLTFVSGSQEIPFGYVAASEKEGTPLIDPLIGGMSVAGLLAATGAFSLRRRFIMAK